MNVLRRIDFGFYVPQLVLVCCWRSPVSKALEKFGPVLAKASAAMGHALLQVIRVTLRPEHAVVSWNNERMVQMLQRKPMPISVESAIRFDRKGSR